MNFLRPLPCAAALCVGLALTVPARADIIKLGYIDPFSGPAAGINENQSRSLKFVVEMANREGWAGEHKFEVVDFDGKGSTPESLQQLKSATDQGIRYIVQGLSSAVGLAFADAINRHNERNPGKEVLYLTPTNQADELTNEKCNFWLFRFDSSASMKTEGLTTFLAQDKAIKKVYLINQNYPAGQAVAQAVKSSLKRKRPDIEIVGDDLHPLFQVKDFAPYITKIRASGADAVVTGNWSADLTLLLKASKEASLKTPFYTYHGATRGVPTALAAAGVDSVNVVTYWNPNDNPDALKTLLTPFNAQYNNDDFMILPFYSMVQMLSKAVKNAKSTAPLQVAYALEGLNVSSFNGEQQMRKSDHQIQQSLLLAKWAKVDGKAVKYDLEKTGYGFKTVAQVDPYTSSLPTSCQMKRPSNP